MREKNYHPILNTPAKEKKRPMSSNPCYATDWSIANEEYFRALSDYKKCTPDKSRGCSLIETLENGKNNAKILLRIEENDIEVPRKTLYLIDKIIRDWSQKKMLSLENLQEIFQELQIMKREKPKSPPKRSNSRKKSQTSPPKNKQNTILQLGLTHKEWSYQKKVEEKIKNILIDEEKRILAMTITHGKQELSKALLTGEEAYSQWLAKKEAEDEHKRAFKQHNRLVKKQEKKMKKEAAEEGYKIWLQKIAGRERKDRKLKRAERTRKRQEHAAKLMNTTSKEEVIFALKKWETLKVMTKAQERKRRKQKLSKIKKLEKAQRYSRKNEDEILCYHKNKGRKKRVSVKPEPGPRETMIAQSTNFYNYEIANDSI
ncbi:unnamed protein product [Moneuplotes crassus]|uniref:Uncharacterized protein n=1 Tax=Euplotes crassus TaxID=5936 RepID=A0AAD1USD8_EUPCR|nr:unnamed protein product [Moneuplotes crassus]